VLARHPEPSSDLIKAALPVDYPDRSHAWHRVPLPHPHHR
jgi:hypothetical protein